MSADNALKMLEEMILGTQEPRSNSKYVIFLTGRDGEVPLPEEYLIELLLLYDTNVFDMDTLSILFDVCAEDIIKFTESHPSCWEMWEDSIATMWTKSMRFYEDDLEDLSWISRYAIKRAKLAVTMDKSIIEATYEMGLELDEDAGWTDNTLHLRVEGLIERNKRESIMEGWFSRAKEDNSYGDD